MSSSEGFGSGAYGGYDYEYDGDLLSADLPCVWPDDSDDDNGYLHSHPVDDSDDDFILQGPEAEKLEEWFSTSLAIPRPVSLTSPTVDDSWDDFDEDLQFAAEHHYVWVDDDDDYLQSVYDHPAAPVVVAAVSTYCTTSSKRKTASARGDSVPVVRDWPGSPDFYGATFIAIVPVGLSPAINTFGSCGLVRGRLRRLR